MENSVISATLILAALALKGSDLVKYAVNAVRFRDASTEAGKTSRDESKNGLWTLFWSSVVGILIAFAVKATQWSDEVMVGEEALSALDFTSTIVFGIVLTTVAATLYDFKKAIDGGDNAQKPKLNKEAEEKRVTTDGGQGRAPVAEDVRA